MPTTTTEAATLSLLDRDLCWLQFNRRVLHEALDPRTPLLERVKFLAIVSNNLDEFFMKRIGGLKQQIAAGVHSRSADGRVWTSPARLSRNPTGAQAGNPNAVRRHAGGETLTLLDYRNRYAQYRLDPQLQDAHARHPFLVTWDDHEVQNNYAGDRSENPQIGRDEFLARRAQAYRAYYEHLPMPRRMIPHSRPMSLPRCCSWPVQTAW